MKKNYTHLIYKSLDGSLETQEQKLLDEWLQADKANALNYEQILKIWKDAEGNQYPELKQELDVNGAYDKVMGKLKKPRVTKIKNNNWAFRIAASLLILVGFAGLMQWNANNNKIYESVVSTDTRIQHTLPDNSIVWLEQHTTLEYKKDFDQSRSLKLDGVATFEVTHNPDKPFTISTQAVDVTVLGTKFVVNAEENTSNYIDVINGRVRVQNAKAKSDTLILTKGMKALVESNHSLAITDEVNSNEMFWATKQLSYNNKPLVQIFEDLQTYYDTSIDYDPADFSGCFFQGSFTDDSIEQIFSSLKLIYDFTIIKGDDSKYKLKGAPCK